MEWVKSNSRDINKLITFEFSATMFTDNLLKDYPWSTKAFSWLLSSKQDKYWNSDFLSFIEIKKTPQWFLSYYLPL